MVQNWFLHTYFCIMQICQNQYMYFICIYPAITPFSDFFFFCYCPLCVSRYVCKTLFGDSKAQRNYIPTIISTYICFRQLHIEIIYVYAWEFVKYSLARVKEILKKEKFETIFRGLICILQTESEPFQYPNLLKRAYKFILDLASITSLKTYQNF